MRLVDVHLDVGFIWHVNLTMHKQFIEYSARLLNMV